MVEAAHAPPPDTSPPPRTRVDRILRMVLTAAVLAFVWNGIRMVRVIRDTRDFQPYVPESGRSGALETDAPRARQKAIAAAFPLPLYPGAREPEYGRLEINGNPFYRCEYEVAAPAAKVLRFYRRRLRGKGWSDTTEALLDQSLRVEDPSQSGILDLQNETFLRYFDQLKRTQARFTRRGASVVIAVADGSQPYLTHVGVRYVEGGGPEVLARQLEEALDPDGAGPGRPMEFTQHFGKREALHTRILSRRESPKRLLGGLVASYEREGWTQVGLPPEAAPGGHGACLIRDRDMVFINVTRDEDARSSTAMVTVMGPG